MQHDIHDLPTIKCSYTGAAYPAFPVRIIDQCGMVLTEVDSGHNLVLYPPPVLAMPLSGMFPLAPSM